MPGYPGFDTPRRDWRARIAFRFVSERRWWNQINTMIFGGCDVDGCGADGCELASDATGMEDVNESMISSNRSSTDVKDNRISFNFACKA